MNILIIGDGFVGSNLYDFYSKKINCTLTNKKNMDVLIKSSISSFFKKNNYSHIIYCAGLKDVGMCEKKSDLAYNINAEAVKNITCFLNNNEKFIYISTDYVFDGEIGNYTENSITNPKTIYGKSKLLGEMYTLEYINSCVVRTSGVYGKNCGWMSWLIQELLNNKNVECYSDIYNSPTYIDDLAQMLYLSFEYSGIINLAGADIINRYNLYKTLAECYNLDSSLLKESTSNINIPKNISLNINLYKSLYKYKPLDIKSNFLILKEQYENKYNFPIS